MSLRVLNLGAGVQSTTLYLMYLKGVLTPQIDYAIFADTQDEPDEVYRHLEWLQSLNGPPILVRTKGRLSEHLKRGVNSTGQRFVSIPAFTVGEGEEDTEGKLKRQCSKEYKTEVIDRAIRRELLGLKPRQRVRKNTSVTQIFGISLDEGGRALRIRRRLKEQKWIKPEFPLIEQLFFVRAHCLEWLSEHSNMPHPPPRSACVYCPFHSDPEWLRLKGSAKDWALAVEVDEALRKPGNVVNRKLDQSLYLHRTCKPLVQIEFDPNQSPRDRQTNLNFARECTGMCGI